MNFPKQGILVTSIVILLVVAGYFLWINSGNINNTIIPSNPSTVSSESRKSGKTIQIKNEPLLPDRIDQNPILMNNLITNRVYLMNKSGQTLYEWGLKGERLGVDASIGNDGKLLVSLKSFYPDNSKTFPGGGGGVTQIRGKHGEIFWENIISNNTESQHHDVEVLPNGNLLMLVWKQIEKDESKKHGYKLGVVIYPETIMEIDSKNNSIVWEWNSMDHIIQDINPNLPKYGNIAKHPERIDINYAQSQSGMIMHANGLTYDRQNDLIYVSLYSMSEIWVIDHSTTTQQARGSIGGKYQKGGDLVYRFGNPATYGGTGERFLYAAHHPSFTESGTFLIYSNGIGAIPEQSTIYELQIPDLFGTQIGAMPPPPKILWSYTNPDIYFDKVGGVVRLPNGNTLITEGDGTLWEITPEKQIAWKYSEKPAMFWRTYAYPIDSPAIRSLGIYPR